MKLHTLLALACAVAITGCKREQGLPPQVPAKEAPAKEAPAKAPSIVPTAAEFLALIDKATRIEAGPRYAFDVRRPVRILERPPSPRMSESTGRQVSTETGEP